MSMKNVLIKKNLLKTRFNARTRQKSFTSPSVGTTSSLTTATSPSVVEELQNPAVAPPTREQLRRVFTNAAVPMAGFGFMDQTVMLQAGHAIDCTIGVTFGLSTLTAAAFGQICSDAAGVTFGGTLESVFNRLGWMSSNSGLTLEQRYLPIVKRTKFAGSLAGVMFGCTLGLLNLYFLDTDRSSTLKLQAFNDEQEFEFQIEASNAAVEGVTALTVRGPDVDGILASMAAALAVRGCSLVELHAKRKAEDPTVQTNRKEIEDVFYVVNRETGLAYEDEELEDLAKDLLDSTRSPMNVHAVKSRMRELESLNANLKDRVNKLEQVIAEKQITIIPKSGRE